MSGTYTGKNPSLVNSKTIPRSISEITSRITDSQFPDRTSRLRFTKSNKERFSRWISTEDKSTAEMFSCEYE